MCNSYISNEKTALILGQNDKMKKKKDYSVGVHS